MFEDTPLEVILVNARSTERPSKAQAIAQANLAGGGEAAHGPRHLAAAAVGHGRDRRLAEDARRKQIEQLQEQQQQLLAQIRREVALLPPPDPKRDAGTPAGAARRKSAGASCCSCWPRSRSASTTRTRGRRSATSARPRAKSVYAIYYDTLRRKIEERGTRDFPESQGQEAVRRADDEHHRRCRRAA